MGRSVPRRWRLSHAVAGTLVVAAVWAWLSGSAGFAWWYLTATTPPTIEATLPAGPVRARIETQVAVRSPGSAALTDVALDGQSRGAAVGAVIEIDTTALPDGPHVLRLTAHDRSLRRTQSTLELPFTSDNTPPALTITPLVAAQRLRAGQVAALRVSTSEPAELRAEWQGTPLPLLTTSDASGAQLALLAFPVTATAGATTLSVSGRDPAGNSASQQTDLTVDAVTVPRQNLLVPAALAELATGPVARDESARLAALTSSVRPERLWSGEFRTPVAGPRTTGFGDRRDYADGHVASHSGYDVAAPERTPVLASAAGVVAHAGTYPQRGATLILDHGWGIYTLYAHLSETRVAEGQIVAQGQAVGLVGSTGLSTGPHLHWEVRLRGVPVDPDAWLALSRAVP